MTQLTACIEYPDANNPGVFQIQIGTELVRNDQFSLDEAEPDTFTATLSDGRGVVVDFRTDQVYVDGQPCEMLEALD